MLGIIMVLLCLAAVLFGAFTGNIASVSDGVLEGAKNAVEFCFKLCGSICFFCGLVKVAEKAGITAFISRLLKPFIRFAMPDALKDEKTNQAVCMNISSNMLGLGNAAKPFGVKGSRLSVSYTHLEKVASATAKEIARMRKNIAVQHKIVQNEYSRDFTLVLTLKDDDRVIFNAELYSPTKMQAEIMAKCFQNKPTEVYKKIISVLTENR